VPVLAKGKTVTGRCWTYVRDDRPFGGQAPPAAVFFYSRDRSSEHPQQHLASWSGILQADAYSGYGKLYNEERGVPILEASCWAHARRKFFELADIEAAARRKARGRTPPVISPIALQAVQRIDALFEIERGINRLPAEQRLVVRQAQSAPLVVALEAWMREERRKLSRHADLAGGNGLHAEALGLIHPLPRRRQDLPLEQCCRASAEAKVVIEAWRRHYNEVRPHSSIGYLTPAVFAAKLNEQRLVPQQAVALRSSQGFAPRPVATPSLRGQDQEPALSS
jgi:hypothetical protein